MAPAPARPSSHASRVRRWLYQPPTAPALSGHHTAPSSDPKSSDNTPSSPVLGLLSEVGPSSLLAWNTTIPQSSRPFSSLNPFCTFLMPKTKCNHVASLGPPSSSASLFLACLSHTSRCYCSSPLASRSLHRCSPAYEHLSPRLLGNCFSSCRLPGDLPDPRLHSVLLSPASCSHTLFDIIIVVSTSNGENLPTYFETTSTSEARPRSYFSSGCSAPTMVTEPSRALVTICRTEWL